MTYGDINTALQDHMDNQPYEIKCAGCGRDLGHDSTVDSDGDLTVEVTPCEVCLDEAKAEARKEVEA